MLFLFWVSDVTYVTSYYEYVMLPRRCPRGVMVKAMDCGIIESEFELQSHYYVHFRENTLGKGMNPLILPVYGLNSTTTVLSRRMALALNNLQRLICH